MKTKFKIGEKVLDANCPHDCVVATVISSRILHDREFVTIEITEKSSLRQVEISDYRLLKIK